MDTPEFPTVFSQDAEQRRRTVRRRRAPGRVDEARLRAGSDSSSAKRCKHVAREDAAGVIAGYVVINDVSVRDYQLRTPQWTLSKSFDTHGVVGPSGS